ncbi:unnamed protein product, partial [marine sediment metagenome]
KIGPPEKMEDWINLLFVFIVRNYADEDDFVEKNKGRKVKYGVIGILKNLKGKIRKLSIKEKGDAIKYKRYLTVAESTIKRVNRSRRDPKIITSYTLMDDVTIKPSEICFLETNTTIEFVTSMMEFKFVELGIIVDQFKITSDDLRTIWQFAKAKVSEEEKPPPEEVKLEIPPELEKLAEWARKFPTAEDFTVSVKKYAGDLYVGGTIPVTTVGELSNILKKHKFIKKGRYADYEAFWEVARELR